MPAPKGDTNRCPNCGMNRLQVDKVVSVDNAYSDKLYIHQKIQGHCKLCGVKLSWIASYLHHSNTEVMIEHGYEEQPMFWPGPRKIFFKNLLTFGAKYAILNSSKERKHKPMARINNVPKSSLQYLTKGIHYNIVDAHALEPRKISHPIPYDTGLFMDGRFPSYLNGFENYYAKKRSFWRLKPEYRYNRPQYTIEITPIVYDIVLTPWGEDAVQERFKKYQRLAKRYNAFLNK